MDNISLFLWYAAACALFDLILFLILVPEKLSFNFLMITLLTAWFYTPVCLFKTILEMIIG